MTGESMPVEKFPRQQDNDTSNPLDRRWDSYAGVQVQIPIGDHRKAPAHFSGARGFDGGVQGQQVGLLGLEGVADSEPDSYSRKGLQLLVDGAEPESIRSGCGLSMLRVAPLCAVLSRLTRER